MLKEQEHEYEAKIDQMKYDSTRKVKILCKEIEKLTEKTSSKTHTLLYYNQRLVIY